ncbi:related to Metal homeostatis protein BSD2 [Zygosaccharomyces bailii]|nr:related to Metal homeostatis protein BSD2 [Zygosaccharomyces bailii]
MSDENLLQSQQVGSSRDVVEQPQALSQGGEVSNGDSMLSGTNADEHDLESGIEGQPIGGTLGLRERITREVKTVGRHFNLLDILFRKNVQRTAYLQHGASFDGVFSNLSAKPDTASQEQAAENDTPPTYEEAAIDMAPSYYGVDDDGSGLYYNEICIEGLPTGNIANFVWNMVVSTSFQFVGFLITYILHTSHAAKQGSRFGLGLTMMGYGYSMIPNDVRSKVGKDNALDRVEVPDPNDYDDLHLYSRPTSQDEFQSTLSEGVADEAQKLPVLAILVGLFGAFVSAKSIYDYVMVKKMERRYMSQDRT